MVTEYGGDGPLPEGLTEQWAEFLQSPKTLDDLFAHPTLFPLQRRGEMKRMLELAASIEPRTIMEIGADKGGGIFGWTTLPTVEKVMACEVRGTPYRDAFEHNFHHPKFLWMPMSSRDYVAYRRLTRWIDHDYRLIDVLFIDGEKSCFLDDFFTYRPWVRDGGLIFMHDVGEEPMATAYRWACDASGCQQEIIRDYTEADNPPKTPYGNWLKSWGHQSCTVGVIRL